MKVTVLFFDESNAESDLFAVHKGWAGEAAEDEQRLVLLVHLQNCIFIDGFQVLVRLQLQNGLCKQEERVTVHCKITAISTVTTKGNQLNQ